VYKGSVYVQIGFGGMALGQGLATIFVRGPHCSFISVSRPHFSQKGKVKAKKISLRGPDVARGPYVAHSCSRVYPISVPDNYPENCCLFKSGQKWHKDNNLGINLYQD